MAETDLTIRLKAVDQGAIDTLNNASTGFGILTAAGIGLSFAFTGLQKVADSSFATFAVGAKNAEKLSGAIAHLAEVNTKAVEVFGALSDAALLAEQALVLVKGAQEAAEVFTRVSQTFELFRASGVSTKSIEDFYTLTDAIKGSEAALDQFAINSVQELAKFEQAAARAGTILRSNLNFDPNTGQARRASAIERQQNAFQVQDIVNKDLKNSVTSTQALAGQYEVLSSGFTKAAESQQVLTAGLKLVGVGKAGGVAVDTSESLRLLTKTLNAYQLSASEAGKTAAVLNGIVENGLTTVPELSLSFGQTATSAKAARIALDDLGGATATLTTQGIDTSTALTGLQRVAADIISKTPDAQKALDKLSLNGQKIRFDQAEIQSKGFTQALLDLNKAAGGSAKVLQDIFPDEIAFRTVVALLTQDGEKLKNNVASIGATTAKSLDDVFEIGVGDRVSRFQQIANRFQELIIRIASSVAPVFESGIGVLEKISTFFTDLPEPVKQAIGQFIVFQITTRATTSAIQILFGTLAELAGNYLIARVATLLLTGELGKELAIMRELITQRKGLIALTLQLFGVDQRYRLATEATTASMEKQNLVSRATAATRAKVTEIFNQNVASFTGENFEDAKETSKAILGKGKAAVGNAVQSVKNVGLGVAEAAGVVVAPQILGPDGRPLSSTGLGRVKEEAAKVGDAIASGLNAAKEKIAPKVEEINNAVTSRILGADGQGLPIKQIANNIAADAQLLASEVEQKFQFNGKAILEKGKEAAGSAVQSIRNVGLVAAPTAVNSALQSVSPQALREKAASVGDAIASGMNLARGKVVAKAEEISTTIGSAFQTVLPQALKEKATKVGEEVANGLNAASVRVTTKTEEIGATVGSALQTVSPQALRDKAVKVGDEISSGLNVAKAKVASKKEEFNAIAQEVNQALLESTKPPATREEYFKLGDTIAIGLDKAKVKITNSANEINNVIQNIRTLPNRSLERVKLEATRFGDAIASGLETAKIKVNTKLNGVSSIFQNIKALPATSLEKVKELGARLSDSINSGLSVASVKVRAKVDEVSQTIQNIKALPVAGLELAKQQSVRFGDAIASGLEQAKTKIGTTKNAVIQTAQDVKVFSDASVSKAKLESGRFGDAISQGIDTAKLKVSTKVGELSETLQNIKATSVAGVKTAKFEAVRVGDAINQGLDTAKLKVSAKVGELGETLQNIKATSAVGVSKAKLEAIRIGDYITSGLEAAKVKVVSKTGEFSQAFQSRLFRDDGKLFSAREIANNIGDDAQALASNLQQKAQPRLRTIGSNLAAGVIITAQEKEALGKATASALDTLKVRVASKVDEINSAFTRIKSLPSTGLEKLKQESAKIGDIVNSGLTTTKGKILSKVEEVNTAFASRFLGADGKLIPVKQIARNLATEAQGAIALAQESLQSKSSGFFNKTKEVANNAFQSILQLKPNSALSDRKPPALESYATESLKDLLGTNARFQAAQFEVDGLANETVRLSKEIEKQKSKLETAQQRLESSKSAALESKDKVFSAPDDIDPKRKQRLIDEAIAKQEASDVANDKVTEIEKRIANKQSELQKTKNASAEATSRVGSLEEELTPKYAEAANKLAIARQFDAAAAAEEEKAIAAKTKATELEKLASLKPEDIALETEARTARTAAIALEEKAVELSTSAETELAAANRLLAELNREAILAERGLTETRIFGRNVLFSVEGPLGAINKLLATEITLNTLAAGSTEGLAIAQGTAAGAARFLGSAISFTSKGLLGLATGGARLASEAIGGIVGALGPLAPLLAVAGLGVFAFRDDLFGLRKTSNEAAQGIQEILDETDKLTKKFGREKRLIEFKAELKPENATTATVETRLEQLRLSGDLTTGQFEQLRETLKKVGSQGKLTSEGLEQFKIQLESIRQGAQGKPEKGVGDRIGDFFGGILPGIGNFFDDTATAIASAFFRPLDSFSTTARNREADKLIQNVSQIGILTNTVGEQSLITDEDISKYRKAQGLSPEVNKKIREGAIKLSGEDLQVEEQAFNSQKLINEKLIAGVEKNIEEQQKTLQGIKDPELKVEFEDRIKLLETERETLEKRNNALKVGREEFVKYYSETLPNLKQAIVETTNLSRGLANSRLAFENQFKLDAQGKPTAYFKDINTLRTEASQYQNQILEAYQGGLFEKVTPDEGGKISPTGPYLPKDKSKFDSGEDTAALLLRQARDNKIKLPDGTEGFRLSLSDRLTATQKIVELDQAESKNRVANINLEVDRTKDAVAQRVKASETSEREIAQLQIKSSKEALAQKEIEVKEYAQFPVRKAQLEREAAVLRVQIEQGVAAEDTRLLNKSREHRQEAYNIEAEQIKALQSGRSLSAESAEKQLTQIQIKSTKDKLNSLIHDYERTDKSSVDLQQKIATIRSQLQQQEAAEDTRLLNKRREQRQEAYNIESEQIKALQSGRSLSAESAEKQLAQIQIKGTRDKLGSLIHDYERTDKSSVDLQQKIASTRALLQQQEAAEDTRLLNKRREQRQESFTLEIDNIKALQSERLIGSQQSERQIADLQIQQSRDRLNNLIADYEKGGKASVDEEQKISALRLQIRTQEAQKIELLFTQEQERQKRILQINAQNITLPLQLQTSNLEEYSKKLEQTQQLSSSRSQLSSTRSDSFEAGIQNQLKFTGDIEKRAQLETQITENKLRSLTIVQKQERLSLDIQTQTNRLQLEREIIQNRIQKVDNQRQQNELQLELIKARREKRTPEEITIIQQQIKSLGQQNSILDTQSARLDRTKIQQAEIAENSRTELGIKQQTATTNATIEIQLSRIKEIQAGIEKQSSEIGIAAQTIQLAGQIQVNQSESLVKTYEQQKSLLTATQNLVKGRLDFVEGELNIASQIATSEREKQLLARSTAAIKLRSLQTQLDLEEKVLDLNLKQQKAQLDQEKIRNSISQSQNVADVAKAQADEAKLKLDLTASPEAKKAAQLQVQAKIEEGIGLQFSGILLDKQGGIQETLGNIERQNLREKGQLQRDQAEVEFAKTLPAGQQRNLLRNIKRRSLRNATGLDDRFVNPEVALGAFVNQTTNTLQNNLRDPREANQAVPLQPLQQYYAGLIGSRLNPQQPSLQVEFPDYEKFRKDQLAKFQEFGYQLPLSPKLSPQELNAAGQKALTDAVSKLNELIEKKLSTANSVSVEAPITNNFSTQDAATGKAADTTTQQIRQQLYDLATQLNRV